MPITSAVQKESLEVRHQAISRRIEVEQSRPAASDLLIKSLKRQKLHLKEQIEGIV